MSAIVVLQNLDSRPVDRDTLVRLVDSLEHRGKDGSGIWLKRNLGLGHRLLHTTPESFSEKQPLEDPVAGLVICADARLDNRDELARQLEIDSEALAASTDPDLILASYRRWGTDCPRHLLGDFVFVVWDPSAGRLFFARDTAGAKHLYYLYRPGRFFAAASEVKALLEHPDVPRELNELGVADHLLPTYDDTTSTLFKGIVRLPANHSMEVTADRLVLQRYWEPNLDYELRLGSDEEYAEAFRDVFTKAVACRLRSAFPVGTTLSGGLDSSSISCIAARMLAEERRGPLHTFSSVWPSLATLAPQSDERDYIRSVHACGNMEPHFIEADRLSPLAEWEQMMWHQDAPLSAPNMYMDWAMFKAAGESGVRVLLGGTDGDTTVSYGIEDLAELARRGRLVRLGREVVALSRGRPQPIRLSGKILWRCSLKPLIPESTWRTARRLRGRPGDTGQERKLPRYCIDRPIEPSFANRVDLPSRFGSLADGNGHTPSTTREAHWQNISAGMWSYILECFEKAGAAFGVETRYPFFDRRVIEFCLSLPPGQRLLNGWTRSILRRAMAGILPPDVQWRSGKGRLSAGVNVSLLKYERPLLEEAVLRNPSPIEAYVDVPALQERFRSYADDPLRNRDDAFTLMLVMNLWLWMKNLSSA